MHAESQDFANLTDQPKQKNGIKQALKPYLPKPPAHGPPFIIQFEPTFHLQLNKVHNLFQPPTQVPCYA